jgi:ribosomal protein L37AE/L43A
MSNSKACPCCNSHNVDHFVNDDQLWHCHSCSEMWESDDLNEFVFTNLTILPEYPDPMEGVNI